MKQCGVIRKIDGLGRYCLPVELRRSLHIEVNSEIEIYQEDEYIVICNIQERIGIHKEIDSLGRVVIPKELRDKMGIKDGETRLEVFYEDSKIYLKKYEMGCIFCGEMKGTKKYMGKCVCKECAKKLGETYGA